MAAKKATKIKRSNPILRQLRAMDGKIDRLLADFTNLKLRITNIESNITPLMTDLIERRLEVRDEAQPTGEAWPPDQMAALMRKRAIENDDSTAGVAYALLMLASLNRNGL